MRLRSFKLQNIGLFKDTTVEFDRSAAVIAGKNNSGKTSLLKAIASLTYETVPELPRTTTVTSLTSNEAAALPQRVEWEYEVERTDLEDIARQQGYVWVPLIPDTEQKTMLPAIDGGKLRIRRSVHYRPNHGELTSTPWATVGFIAYEWISAAGALRYRGQQPPSGLLPTDVTRDLTKLVRFFRFDADRSRIHEKQVRRMPEIPRSRPCLVAMVSTARRTAGQVRRASSASSSKLRFTSDAPARVRSSRDGAGDGDPAGTGSTTRSGTAGTRGGSPATHGRRWASAVEGSAVGPCELPYV